MRGSIQSQRNMEIMDEPITLNEPCYIVYPKCFICHVRQTQLSFTPKPKVRPTCLFIIFVIKKSGIRNYYYTVSAKSHIGMIQLILSVAVVVHELTPVADPLHSVEQQAGRTGVLPRLEKRRGVLCYCGK